MKTKMFMLFISLLPLLLFGINLHSKSQPGFKNRFHDVKNQSQLTVNKNPAQRLNSSAPKDREWRLAQILYQYDWDWKQDRDLVNSDMFYYYYNVTQPAQVDSIVRFAWNVNNLSWEYQDTSIYTYDPTGEYIVELNVCNYDYTNIPIIEKYVLVYDSQNRLTDVYEYYDDPWWHRDLELNYKTSLVYTGNRLAAAYTGYYEDFPDCYYSKVDYTHDAQGRIIAGNIYSSMDSLNWGDMEGHMEMSYQTNDTSTENDFNSHLAHNYLSNSDTEYPIFSNSILISEYRLYLDWLDYYNDWEEQERYVYSYNNINQLVSIQEQWRNAYDPPGFWDLGGQYNYNYNANNNLSQIDYRYWDTDLETWSDIMELEIYTWEQHSGSDDNTVPPISSNLSVYPNPFNKDTTISFKLVENSHAKINIYNLKGQLIRTVANGFYAKGVNEIAWDGKSDNGSDVPNGLFIIKLKGDGYTQTRKLTVLK